jgi:phosphate acetyltransferase
MAEHILSNFTYEEIKVGQSVTLVKQLTQNDIYLFGYMSGDVNPAHFNPEYAKGTMFKDVIAHGMWSGSLISTLLGTQLPGPGTIYLSQSLKFSRPVYVGDVITAEIKVTEKKEKNRVVFECTCYKQTKEVVTSGFAEVIAPVAKVSVPAKQLSLKDIA